MFCLFMRETSDYWNSLILCVTASVPKSHFSFLIEMQYSRVMNTTCFKLSLHFLFQSKFVVGKTQHHLPAGSEHDATLKRGSPLCLLSTADGLRENTPFDIQHCVLFVCGSRRHNSCMLMQFVPLLLLCVSE